MDSQSLIIESFSAEEKLEAKKLEEDIDSATGVILAATRTLASNYARLGSLLHCVRAKKYWLLGNYRSFGDYVKFVAKKYDIGHSQLYFGISIAQNLTPLLSEESLCNIGITKASVLSKYAEQSGVLSLPEDLLAMAKDPKTKTEELRGATALRLHQVLPEEVGHWFSFGGAFLLDDEKKTWLKALEIAKAVDPAIPHTYPEWLQLKEAILRLAQEFIAEWGNRI